MSHGTGPRGSSLVRTVTTATKRPAGRSGAPRPRARSTSPSRSARGSTAKKNQAGKGGTRRELPPAVGSRPACWPRWVPSPPATPPTCGESPWSHWASWVESPSTDGPWGRPAATPAWGSVTSSAGAGSSCRSSWSPWASACSCAGARTRPPLDAAPSRSGPAGSRPGRSSAGRSCSWPCRASPPWPEAHRPSAPPRPPCRRPAAGWGR